MARKEPILKTTSIIEDTWQKYCVSMTSSLIMNDWIDIALHSEEKYCTKFTKNINQKDFNLDHKTIFLFKIKANWKENKEICKFDYVDIYSKKKLKKIADSFI